MFKKIAKNLADFSFLDSISSYAQNNWPFFVAQLAVRVFYIFLLYSSIILFQEWDYTIKAQTQISFIPTIAWMNLFSFPLSMAGVKIAFIVTALLASLAPQKRMFRVLAFLAVLEFVSL